MSDAESLDLIFSDFEQLDAKIAQAKQVIRDTWVQSDDPRPWAVAWSGGKDSTSVLKLVCEVLVALPPEQRQKRVVRVVSCDTQMENPLIEAYLHDQSRQFNVWAVQQAVDINSAIAIRKDEHGFFFLVLGKGYPLPGNALNRWCTYKLKILPQNRIYKEIQPSIVVVGARKSESARRDRTLDRYHTDNPYIQHTQSGYDLLAPVVDFTVEDVWGSLMTPLPWGSPEAVKSLYQEATGECGFRNPKGADDPVKACGARFGCWTCPVVDNDRSTETMSQTHRWMEPLTRWRTELKKAYGEYTPPVVPGMPRKERSAILKEQRLINEEIKRTNKSGYRRNKQFLGEGKGILRLTVRKQLMTSLLKTQDELNLLRKLEGLGPLPLIHDEELQCIYDLWVLEERDRPFLV